jgi:hypothetical protein
LAWYEIDLNWYGIWVLQKLGLAKQVYTVKLASLKPQPAPEEDTASIAAPESTTDLVSA